jgi:hypothetical protein
VPVHSPRSTVSSEPTCAVPEIRGTVVMSGGRAAIASVGSVTADAEPASLRAVTITRSRLPTSSGVGTYWSAVAPSMSVQSPPSASHRCHWNVRRIGSVPVHVPYSMWSVAPSVAGPVMVAGEVLCGGAGAAGRASTAAVGSEAALSVPPGPATVTTTRRAWRASSSVAV